MIEHMHICTHVYAKENYIEKKSFRLHLCGRMEKVEKTGIGQTKRTDERGDEYTTKKLIKECYREKMR